MSNQANNWLRRRVVGNAYAKNVLFWLCDSADNAGVSHPSMTLERIANMTEFSLATVKRAVKYLEANNFIQKVPYGRKNLYKINFFTPSVIPEKQTENKPKRCLTDTNKPAQSDTNSPPKDEKNSVCQTPENRSAGHQSGDDYNVVPIQQVFSSNSELKDSSSFSEKTEVLKNSVSVSPAASESPPEREISEKEEFDPGPPPNCHSLTPAEIFGEIVEDEESDELEIKNFVPTPAAPTLAVKIYAEHYPLVSLDQGELKIFKKLLPDVVPSIWRENLLEWRLSRWKERSIPGMISRYKEKLKKWQQEQLENFQQEEKKGDELALTTNNGNGHLEVKKRSPRAQEAVNRGEALHELRKRVQKRRGSLS